MPRSFVCTLALVLSFSAFASERWSSDIRRVEVTHDGVGLLQLESQVSSSRNKKETFRTGSDQLVRETRSGESAGTNGTLPSGWLEKPFKEFSIQCSHNTFLHGSQFSQTVDASVVYTALELGYRCVEIDVYLEGGNLEVHHDVGPGFRTNHVRFKEFVDKIKEWCEQDESNNPTSFKLPLIINIQNEAKDAPAKLKSEIYDALGPRIVMPADFTINTPLKELAVQGQGEKRKVLLRSTRLKGGDEDEYAKIVAMSKYGEQKGAVTKSIETGFINKNWFYSGGQSYVPSDTNLEDVAKAKKTSHLVRTYPHKTHTSSVNYKPFYFFKQKAHMICINFQGRCPNDHDGCKGPIKGEPGGSGDCHCLRDVAAGLERVFHDFGYDGYMHMETLSDQGWDAIAGNSKFQYDDEWKHGSRRRLPYPPNKDWDPIKA